MWNTTGKAWQAVFEQCWEAFKSGSLPIGAVITGENGEVISCGRNRGFDKSLLNPRIAHAEMDALHKLDIWKYPELKTYALYTSMEPCPMCMGAIVMAGIRKLQVAARDGWAGSVHLVQKDPYMSSKNMQINFEFGALETVSLTMMMYWCFRKSNGEINRAEEAIAKDNPAAIGIAKSLYAERRLDWHVSNKTPFGVVFDEIASAERKEDKHG